MLISDLAGYVKENIRLSVSGTSLLIKGNNQQMITGEPVQQERNHGSFERVIQLPEPTYPNQIGLNLIMDFYLFHINDNFERRASEY